MLVRKRKEISISAQIARGSPQSSSKESCAIIVVPVDHATSRTCTGTIAVDLNLESGNPLLARVPTYTIQWEYKGAY